MIEQIFTLLIILFTYLTYSCYLKPKKTHAWYQQKMQELGYKVYVYPFKAFSATFVDGYVENEKKYGDAQYSEIKVFKDYDVLLYNMFNVIGISFIRPDLVSQVFSPDKLLIYPKNVLFTNALKFMLGGGIVFSEGQQWKNKRQLMSQVFNFDLLKQNIPKICEICDKVFEENQKQYEQNSQENSKKGTYQLYTLTIGAKIFNNVMMKCFFGSDQLQKEIEGENSQTFLINLVNNAYEKSFHPLLLLFGTWPYKIGLTKSFRDLKRKIAIFEDLAIQKINQRIDEIKQSEEKNKPSDIIQAMLMQNSKNSAFKLNAKYLVEEFTTFLTAGTDTTAHLFMMMIYYITKNQKVEQRLRRQIKDVIKNNDELTFDNLKKLEYVDWIQNEVTRMYGPGTGLLPRESSQDHFIKNIPIKKGINISVQPLGSHYNQKYFINPEQFRPERWEKQCNYLEPFAFMGFSGGPRSCLGKQLALLESKIALIKIIQRYSKIDIPSDKKEKMIMTMKLVYEPLPFLTTYTKASTD